VFSLLALNGCTTSSSHPKQAMKIKDRPETVLVTYHVKPGMEMVFEHLLSQAWETYRSEHMAFAEPHVIVREAEENNTTGYVEIFTWVNHAAPEKASDAVKKLWAQEASLCVTRGGHTGISGGEVEPIVPPRR
jgi:hypothetical protein